MTKIKFESGPTIDRDLERVVEPLASFICATRAPESRPRFRPEIARERGRAD